jgi:glycosyltransferase involved in cell wall biosynthesis
MPTSSVSVVVPCYNYGRYLRDCVVSVLGQAGVDARVLVIDDASADDSAAVAAELAAADPRVELRSHAVNQGHVRTYNEGLQWATGTYTLLLSADDMLTPGALQRACALLDARLDVGFVYGRALVFRDDRPRPRPKTGPARWTIWPGREWFEMRCRMTECCIHSPEVVVRTSLLRQLGGYRDELPHAGDLEMWMRLALHADVGYIAGPHQAYYRDHLQAMHRVGYGTVLADLVQVRAAFEVLFRDHGLIVADRQRLEAVVRRMVARRALRAACREYDRARPNPTAVAALEELATMTYSDAHGLGEWRGLQRRKRLGPRLSWVLQPFMVMTAQSVYRVLKRRRLQRQGLCLQRAIL